MDSNPDPRFAAIRSRRARLVAVLLVLPVVLAVGFLAAPSPARDGFVLLWVAGYAATAMAVAFSRCPACGGLFHRVLGFANPLARRCAGCGTPAYGARGRAAVSAGGSRAG